MVTTRKQFDFTSEAVSEGHPDKICDRISDTVLDEIIKEDPKARVACETFATTNKIILGGEVTEIEFSVAYLPTATLAYYCTFPGHWTIMKGILRVVA